MKEYIERQAVEEFIQDGLNNPDKSKAFGHDAIEILAGIHFMLAADVAPVRYGRWKNGGNGLYDTCSACGKEIYLAIPMNYCPECGALMDGKEDEHEVSES